MKTQHLSVFCLHWAYNLQHSDWSLPAISNMEVAIYFLVNKQWLDTTDILMDRCLKFISEKNNEKVIDTNLLFHRKHASKAISLCLY